MKKRHITHDDVVAALEASPGASVKVAVCDIDGILRGKIMQKEKFLHALQHGFGFCSVIFGWDCADKCYDNASYTGWHTGYPDATAWIDPQTMRFLPFEQGQPLFLADFTDKAGAPLAVCPRQVLRGVIAKLQAAGLTATVGCEFEWFNFRETPQSLVQKGFRNPEPITPGMCGYSLLRTGQNQPFADALFNDLTAMGIPLEALHTETGPGVYEAALAPCDALESADRATLFKTAVKQIAHRFGITASFMAKWNTTLPGSGGHLHQSLTDRQGRNVFFDAQDGDRMSATFRHYIAGQMHCLPELLPFFAPNVNSYKRLVEGAWAPTTVTWGVDNRTAALRVVPGGASSTRLETRVGGADINPYLALAAALASGLYCIEKKLPLPDKGVLGSAYQGRAAHLALNLPQAVNTMMGSTLARTLFGETFITHFAQTRLWEWRQFENQVTDWELQRYFETI